MSDLLFQRQDDREFIVLWCGQAGHYLREELNTLRQQYPPRDPSPTEMHTVYNPRQRVAASQSIAKQVLREQRIARGLCPDCANTLIGLERLCFDCRRKASAYQKARWHATRDARKVSASRIGSRGGERLSRSVRLHADRADLFRPTG